MSRFSPCGSVILTATNFNRARVWDVREKQLRPIALLHSSQVWGMTTNSNCDRIVTANYDNTARVWDAVIGKPLSPPLLHNGGVSEVSFSRDGTHILKSNWDHTVRLWPVIEPIPDEVERATVWVETMTGLRLGVTGSPELLTSAEWAVRKKRLDELGGPPWTQVRPGVIKPSHTPARNQSTPDRRARKFLPPKQLTRQPACIVAELTDHAQCSSKRCTREKPPNERIGTLLNKICDRIFAPSSGKPTD